MKEEKMKKKILGLVIGFMLVAVNLFAADGDLIVNGNVGIGTTNPTEKLEVNGNVKAAGLLAPGTIGQIESVSPTADTTTNSTSFVDMDGMSITLTTAGNSKLLIFWNAGIYRNNTNKWIITEAQVDGNRVGAAQAGAYSYDVTGGAGHSIGGNALATVSAGSHTVKIRWRVTGGTASNSPTASPDVYGRTLTVIEVRQ
jgi:hypothetical protein